MSIGIPPINGRGYPGPAAIRHYNEAAASLAARDASGPRDESGRDHCAARVAALRVAALGAAPAAPAGMRALPRLLHRIWAEQAAMRTEDGRWRFAEAHDDAPAAALHDGFVALERALADRN